MSTTVGERAHMSQSAAPVALPDEPLVVIEPRRASFGFDLHSLWEYRELLYLLMWRDVKVRYKQTVLGIGWIVMQPLLMTLIFTIFLGNLARVPSGDVPYPLLVYTGLLPWTFFANSVSNSGNSLVGSAQLVTKVYFPRIIIPSAAVGARLVDIGVAFVILAGLMIYYRVGLTVNVFMLPVLMLLVTLLALGTGMWISALNVKYRDVGVAMPVLIQLWMFASPVVYSSNLVPQEWRTLYALNPLVGIIDGFRASLFGEAFDWLAIAVSTVVMCVLFVYATYVFRRTERIFADVI